MSEKIKPTIELLAVLARAVYLESEERRIQVTSEVSRTIDDSRRYYGILQALDTTLYRTELIFRTAEEAQESLQSIYNKRHKILDSSMQELTKVIRDLSQPDGGPDE